MLDPFTTRYSRGIFKKIVGLHTTWKPMVDPVIQSKKVLIFENIANITMLIQIPRVGK